MPVSHNVNPHRQSGRLRNQIPVICDGDGWPTHESINYLPNGGPLGDTDSQCPTSSSLSSFNVLQPDRSNSHVRQQEHNPYLLSNEQSQSSTVISYLPSPRKNRSRHRKPGHIPRPRNAFIIFRSFYVRDRTSAGEGQQNELSKQAGKVWNKMTGEEKFPFVDRANMEKKQHQAMYPNYIYCPGGRKERAVTKNTKNTGRSDSKRSATSSRTSEFTFPEIPFAAPAQRSLRAAARRATERFLQPHSMSPTPEESPMLENLEFLYLEPVEDVTIGLRAPQTDTSVEEDAFVRTVLRLTPIEKEEPELQFDTTMRPLHLDRIPEQFGFKYDSESIAMLAFLSPMPSTNDNTAYTGDVSSLFSQLSCFPANPPAIRMANGGPNVFSSDGNFTEWPRFTTHYAAGFPWSSYHEHYTSMPSEGMLENDMTFMGTFFNFDETHISTLYHTPP